MFNGQENSVTKFRDRSSPRARLNKIFRETATRVPYRTAITDGSRAITYGELNDRVESLVREILAVDGSRGSPVGLILERSPEYIVALLGALRAGAPFVPIDPGWPDDRIEHVLEASGAAIELRGDPTAASRLMIRTRSTTPGAAAPQDDDVAYIVYTSGSSGEPKGVEITPLNLLNLMDWHFQAFDVSPDDRVGWTAGLAFDASIWELLPSLAAGAAIHIPAESTRASAAALRRWLIEEKITLSYVATPLAESLITQSWPDTTALRLLLTGGDMLHGWPRGDLPFRVVNNYGPTECTVVATSGILRADDGTTRLPPIGKPIANCRIAIIDETGQRVSAGAIGEIYIAGANVGRGYRNNPALTEERFVTLTLPGEEPTRYYRTGDLAAFTPDGDIVIHGRSDNQIKIRGHRIEPDEIAAVLLRHPAVSQSVVVADGDGIDKRLVAYVVFKRDQTSLRASELRDLLIRSLPNYMLPAVYVRVPSLPLTANGKIDRANLPVPTSDNMLSGMLYRAPQSPLESRIASIVESLLGIRGVGIDDNFFLLGGHSLLGTQLILRLRDTFGVELSLRDLFEARTIQNLAAKVERSAFDMVLSSSEEDLERRFCVS